MEEEDRKPVVGVMVKVYVSSTTSQRHLLEYQRIYNVPGEVYIDEIASELFETYQDLSQKHIVEGDQNHGE